MKITSINLEIILYVVIIFILFIILWNTMNKKGKEHFVGTGCQKVICSNITEQKQCAECCK